MISYDSLGTKELINDQLSDLYKVEPSEGGWMVVTPSRYPDNTEIAVYLSSDRDGHFVVSDRAEAVDYAFVNGVGAGIVRDRLKKAKKRIDARPIDQDEISLEIKTDSLAKGILMIVEAIQDVCYSVYTRASQHSARRFRAEVENFLALERFAFERRVQIQGKTGLRTFDYVVQGRSNRQLLLAMFEATTPSTAINRAKVISYDYEDVRDSSDVIPPLAVFVDPKSDNPNAVRSPEVSSILAAHVGSVHSWIDRHSLVKEFLAA
jgi:hypothetical protein